MTVLPLSSKELEQVELKPLHLPDAMQLVVAKIESLLRNAPPPPTTPAFGGILRPSQIHYVQDIFIARKRRQADFCHRLYRELQKLYRLWLKTDFPSLTACLTLTMTNTLNKHLCRNPQAVELLEATKMKTPITS